MYVGYTKGRGNFNHCLPPPPNNSALLLQCTYSISDLSSAYYNTISAWHSLKYNIHYNMSHRRAHRHCCATACTDLPQLREEEVVAHYPLNRLNDHGAKVPGRGLPSHCLHALLQLGSRGRVFHVLERWGGVKGRSGVGWGAVG